MQEYGLPLALYVHSHCSVLSRPYNVCSCLQGTREQGASIVVTNVLGQDLPQVLLVEAKHEWGACEGPNTQVQALATYARTASRHLHCPALCETVFPALLLEAIGNGLRCEAVPHAGISLSLAQGKGAGDVIIMVQGPCTALNAIA